MPTDIQLELYKFKVPLAQAWDEATKTLLARDDRNEVERLTVIAAVQLEKQFSSDSSSVCSDPELLALAREASVAFVQTKYTGTLPTLADRESDILAQHGCIWSLIGKLLQTAVGESPVREWIFAHAHSVLVLGGNADDITGSKWKQRSNNILNTLSCFKGTVDERITSLCMADTFLSERDLVVPSVKLLIRSKQFKKLMSAPDMVSDGDKTLPKLLLNIANDKEFRQAFVWLPLDPENPLNQSGGSGVIPTDKADYRFVLSIIMRVLFGKLRQRGNGIDKRSSFAERQTQIMGYIGTIPANEMSIVFETLFGRFVTVGSLDSVNPKWTGSEFVYANSGEPILNRAFIEANHSVVIGSLQLMGHVVGQLKRKVDAFVPLLSVFVVSILAWSGLPVGDINPDKKQQSIHKVCMLRLADLLSVYPHLGSQAWEALLIPVKGILQYHLGRSSAVEVSTAFRIVTSWAHHESLMGLYASELGSALLSTLFSPRALAGGPASALFAMVLTLCGIDEADESARGSTYEQSRRQLYRDAKRAGGEDIDSDSDDEKRDDTNNLESVTIESNVSVQVVANNVDSILAITALSVSKSGDNSLLLRVTVAIAQLASRCGLSLPNDTCSQLLQLLGDLVAPLLATKTGRGRESRVTKSNNTVILFQAITEVVKIVDPTAVPSTLLHVVARPVLTLDDVKGRLVMAECILALTLKVSPTPRDIKSAEVLVAVNSLKNAASMQPDVDRHVDVLQDVLDSEEEDLHGLLASTHLLRHCLFLLGSEGVDSTVRHCAERFVSLIGVVPDQQGRVQFHRLVTVVKSLHHMLDSHSAEGPHRSALKVLIHYVKEYASQLPDSDTENCRLLHKDLLPFTESEVSAETRIASASVLEGLLHIQKFKRSRALAKLVDKNDLISEYTKTTILVPLAIEGIVQPGVAKANYDAGQSDVAIRALQCCGSQIELLMKLVKVHLRKFPEREKVIFKTVSKITEYIRQTRGSVSPAELAKIQAGLVPQLRKRIWDSKGSVKGNQFFVGQEQENQHKLAKDKNADAMDGLVKIDVVVALLEVMKLLPPSDFEQGMPPVVRIILQGLPSRELINRRAAREALRRCAKAMGLAKAAWLMKQVRQTLPRGGYQAAVAVFTCFSILEGVIDGGELVVSRKISTEIANEALELLRIEDRQWAMIQSRVEGDALEAEEIPHQCIEASRHKGHELLELVARCLAPEIATGIVLRNVYSLLNSLDGVEADIDSDDEENEIEPEKDSDSSSSEEDDKKSKKRKKPATKTHSKKDTQLNAAHGKKYYARTEAALTSVISGILANTQFSSKQMLAVAVQALAQFDDIVSRKFRLEEVKLFANNEISTELLNVDDDSTPIAKGPKKAKLFDLRQRQKELTFCVQPGASTGKGHWVTEEWKRGKISQQQQSESKSTFGSIDLKSVKAKILGVMGLKVLSAQLNNLMADDSPDLVKAVGKFVTRSFCSGIADLFQPSAKAIQRLVEAEGVFNAKAMTLIAKRLIASMEQLHHSGSDLSFITLKQQRKHQQAEVASTCSSLLLALMAKEEEWMQPGMLDTLAAHVRASLDKPALQVAALTILRKILLSKKYKSATVYDCLNTVGELLVTATSAKICALCGVLYGQYLVDFPHTPKALMSKIVTLLKQAQSASSAVSRCAALNTIYSFIKALPGKTLQEEYGEIVVVTLAVGMSSEEDATAVSMAKTIVSSVLGRFVDIPKRDRLTEVICNWTSTMTKPQFVFGAAEVATLLARESLLPIEKAISVVLAVIRQLPWMISDDIVRNKGLLAVVRGVEGMVYVDNIETSVGMEKIVQFVAGHLLRTEGVAPVVTVEVLKLVNAIADSEKARSLFSESPQIDESIIDDQMIDSLAPWPLLMRVFRVLTRVETETHLDIASVAMRTIASLLPLTSNSVVEKADEVPIESSFRAPAEEDDSEEEIPVSKADMGLFGQSTASIPLGTKLDTETVVVPVYKSADSGERLVALLKKIRFEVRGLMAAPREAVIRLASLIKLCAALTLASPANDDEDILSTCLEILVRLATINRSAEEVSTEIPEINSLFELSTLRPIQQIGCLSKMANAAIESLEKHYRPIPAFFTKQLTKVTTLVNKSRKDRKISLLNLAISNPARLATLRLQKSKRKSEKKQIRTKEGIKRIHGMIH